MLDNFFELNEPYITIYSLIELEKLLQNTDSLKNFLFYPDLVPPQYYKYAKIRFKDKVFTNASFSKKTIKNVNFTNCTFKDCLFIGTKIEDCEFHNCVFENVNTDAIEISKTYLKAEYFKNAIKDDKYANIAVHLFQKIYANTVETDQLLLVYNAELYFRDWNRKQIILKRKKKEIKFFDFLSRIVPIYIHRILGYGINFWIFSLTYGIYFFICSCVNYYLWYSYSIKTELFDCIAYRTILHSVYFTFFTLTALGAGEMFPQSDVGIISAMIQSLFGYIFIGVFLSMLTKKIMK